MSLKEKLVERLGIDLDSFIEPYIYEQDYELPRMQEALECLEKHVENDSVVYVVVDSDADGYLSASIILRYLKRLGLTTDFILHEKKVHGIAQVMEQLLEDEYDLLIIPDASSSEAKFHNKLIEEKGIDVIVLDHHPMYEEVGESKAIIVNNVGFSKLCGGGVTYQFTEEYDEHSWNEFARENIDLAGISNIADSMPSDNEEVNYMVRDGLGNIKNGFLKFIMYKNQLKELSPQDIAFKVASFINAVTRVGTMKEKSTLIEALSAFEDIPDYNFYRKKFQSLYHRAFLDMQNSKNRQKKIVDKGDYEIIQSPKGLVTMVKVTDEETAKVTGLIANRIMDSTGTPTIVVNMHSGKGSLRSPIEFRDHLNTLEGVDALGHIKACGVFGFKEEHLVELDKFAVPVDPDEVKELDYIHEEDLDEDELYEIAEINANLYGGLKQMMFTTIVGDTFGRTINTKGTMMRIEMGGYTFVCFDKRLFHEVDDDTKVLVSPSLNSFLGTIHLQLIIKEVIK